MSYYSTTRIGPSGAAAMGETTIMDAWRIVAHRTGGPEVLEREAFDPGSPGADEVLIEHRAIGVNFIDTYHRSGLYPVGLPLVPGSEAAGQVVSCGEAVRDVAVGDRVAYVLGPPGAYATHRVVGADRLIRLPEAISDEAAAAVLLKGCTVEMLAERCAPVPRGGWALVHAAAGGVGSMLVPWLASLGVRVIAHAGSADKAERAKAAGAELVLSCAMDDLAAAVRDATNGAGVRVVYDGVGRASWQASVGALARRGMLVSFGNASGTPEPFGVLDLMRAGSLFVTRPTLGDYLATAAERDRSAARLFDMITAGVVGAEPGRRFALADAAQAHRALEARETVGPSVLIP